MTRNRLHSYKEAVKAEVAALQELPDLLEKYMLVASELSSEDNIGLEKNFKWLRACVAMVGCWGSFS